MTTEDEDDETTPRKKRKQLSRGLKAQKGT